MVLVGSCNLNEDSHFIYSVKHLAEDLIKTRDKMYLSVVTDGPDPDFSFKFQFD